MVKGTDIGPLEDDDEPPTEYKIFTEDDEISISIKLQWSKS